MIQEHVILASPDIEIKERQPIKEHLNPVNDITCSADGVSTY